MTSLSTLTTTQETAIRDWLAAHPTLSVGVGDEDSACSVAAINLALSGELTDDIPDCMSEVIGRWIICVQDLMPDTIRNSAAWHDLLPLAAGTGRDHESERMAMIMDWLWGTALPTVQPLAEKHGFGAQWRTMVTARTATAAYAAKDAAIAAANAAIATNYAAFAAADAASAAVANYDAAAAAKYAANAAAKYAALAINYAAYAAADAAFAAANAAFAAADAAYDDAWATFDPVGLLRRLIGVTDNRVEVRA